MTLMKMVSLTAFILAVASLTLLHVGIIQSLKPVQSQQQDQSNFFLANSDTNHNVHTRTERDFATRREYDDDSIDLGSLNEGGTRYDLVLSNGNSGDGDNSSNNNAATDFEGGDGGPTWRQAPISSKNLARLLYGMPQFDRFYAKYPTEKRAGELRRFVSDRDDNEFAGTNLLAARMYREPLGKSTERLVQRLRDQLLLDPRTVREKRRRCQFDPNLGIKSPSSCDTDSYFGASDYTMRNVWDSAGRR